MCPASSSRGPPSRVRRHEKWQSSWKRVTCTFRESSRRSTDGASLWRMGGWTTEPPTLTVGQQRETDHLVQQPRGDVRIPLRRAWSNFAEIEAYYPFLCASDRAEQTDGFIPRQPARNRSAGAGAQRWIESIDVPREINVVRQLLDDFVRQLRERTATLFPLREDIIEERHDPALRVIDHPHLGRTDVADAGLYELRDAIDLRHDVVKDRRMRPGEALVRVAQIGVRVEMQNSETGIALGISL